MTAGIVAKGAGVFKMDLTNGAVSTAVLTGVTNFKLDGMEKKTGVYHTLDFVDAQRTIGGREPKVMVTVIKSTAVGAGYLVLATMAMAGALSDKRTVEMFQPDESTGSEKVSGEFFCAGTPTLIDVEAGKEEVGKIDFPLYLEGAITRSIVT
jgi:hypothetical protein